MELRAAREWGPSPPGSLMKPPHLRLCCPFYVQQAKRRGSTMGVRFRLCKAESLRVLALFAASLVALALSVVGGERFAQSNYARVLWVVPVSHTMKSPSLCERGGGGALYVKGAGSALKERGGGCSFEGGGPPRKTGEKWCYAKEVWWKE